MSSITFYQDSSKAQKEIGQLRRTMLIGAVFGTIFVFALAAYLSYAIFSALGRGFEQFTRIPLWLFSLGLATLAAGSYPLMMWMIMRRVQQSLGVRPNNALIIESDRVMLTTGDETRTILFEDINRVNFRKKQGRLFQIGIVGGLRNIIGCIEYQDMESMLALLRERLGDEVEFRDTTSLLAQLQAFSFFVPYLGMILILGLLWLIGIPFIQAFQLGMTSSFGLWFLFGGASHALTPYIKRKRAVRIGEIATGIASLAILGLFVVTFDQPLCGNIAMRWTGCIRFIEDVRYLTPARDTDKIIYYDDSYGSEELVVLHNLAERGTRFPAASGESIDRIKVSADGTRILLEQFDYLAVFDTNRQENIWQNEGKLLGRAGLSPNGQTLAYQPYDSQAETRFIVNLVNLGTGVETVTQIAIYQITFVTDDQLVLTDYPDPPTIVDIASGQILQTLSWESALLSVDPQPVSEFIVTPTQIAAIGTTDIVIWQRDSGELIISQSFRSEERDTKLALSKDGQFFAMLQKLDADLYPDESNDRIILDVWRIIDGLQVVEWEVANDDFALADSVVFSADNKHLAFTTEDGMFVYDFAWLLENHAP